MRYEYVVKHFPELPDVVQYARSRAKQSYIKYQETRSTLVKEREQGSWKQWFDWL
jgi:outer membrane protein assembly factor BamD